MVFLQIGHVTDLLVPPGVLAADALHSLAGVAPGAAFTPEARGCVHAAHPREARVKLALRRTQDKHSHHSHSHVLYCQCIY